MKVVFIKLVELFILVNVVCSDSEDGVFFCRSSSDCDWCGFCVDYHNIMYPNRDAACFVPYTETTKIVRIPGGSFHCNFKRDLCQEFTCYNNGVCMVTNIYAAPSCMCRYSEEFIGQFCDIKWDGVDIDSWYAGFAVVFDNFKGTFYKGDLYYVTAIAAMFSRARKLQFYLETSEGYAIKFNQPTDCFSFDKSLVYPFKRSCVNCTMHFPLCQLLYKAKVPFPYKVALGPNTLNRTQTVRGYVAQVTLVAKTFNMNHYQEVFRHTYPVVVEYETFYISDKRHLPEVRLQNCGRNVEERIFYYRRSVITLNAEVKFLPKDKINPVWTLWDVEEFRDEYEISGISQIYEGLSWTFKPFSLNFTTYRVELKVKVWYLHNMYAVSNYAECYFEVKKLKVVAVISGGGKVTVNKRFNVVISGKESYDPNVQKEFQDLRFAWTCRPQCDNLIHKTSAFNSEITIPRGLIDWGKTYNFTLKVSAHGFEDGWAHQEIYVSHQEMAVYCRMNCLEKVVPYDPLLLEVRLPLNEQLYRVFHWVRSGVNGTEVSADDVKCKNHTYPSYLLCVEPYALSYGAIYYFTATLENSDADASIQVSVDEKVKFSCNLSPNNGTRFKTLFSISCSKPNNTQTSWVFEFFDKHDEDLDVEFSGRMIATNSLGNVREFNIVRGIIVVYLFDVNGVVSTSQYTTVELVPYNATTENIDHLLIEIEDLIEISEMESALRKASLIPDLVSNESDKYHVTERMVRLLGKLRYESQGIIKLGLRTVSNIITSLTKEGGFTFNQNLVSILAKVMDSLMKWTNYALDLSKTATPFIAKRMFEQMTVASIGAIETLLMNRNVSFLHSSLEDLSPVDYDNAWEASRNIESAIHRVGYALSYRQATGYIKSYIKSAPKLTLLTAHCDYLQLISAKTNKDELVPLKMSKPLINELSVYEELTIHLTSVSYNPFWTSRRDVSTVLLSLDLYDRRSFGLKMNRIAYINNDIDMFFKVLNSTISSTTVTLMQLDPMGARIVDFDEKVTVFRFDLESHSNLFVSFSFQNDSDEIKVYTSDTIRPSYDLVNKSKTIVSSSNPNYNKSTGDTESGKFVYIGVLPGTNVPINGSINMTITFHYKICLTWLRHKWVSHFCRVGPGTNTTHIHCKCSHLSFFSAVFAVPPNELNPFTDVQLFLTIKDNWLILVLVSCLVTMFMFLGVWARHKDATDRVQRKVLVLEDNLPCDNNCYLLAVFTGCRFNAGTSANVGVQIYGNESSSRCHILQSSERKVLTCNSQDWFLFRTPQPLGNISKIHIWHDNSGKSPDWYCNKALVYDLQTAVVYTFFVEEWLALESSEYCEAVILPATLEDMNDIRRIFLENVAFGYRYADLSCSILSPHPRMRISRLDKVVILINFTMVALLVSLAFYKVTANSENAGVDNFGFSYGTIDIIISIETFIITSVVIFIISYTFTKAYKPKREERCHGRASVVYTRQSKKDLLLATNTYTKAAIATPSKKIENRSYYHRLLKRLQMPFNRLPLNPVTLSTYKVKTNKTLYFIAWILSMFIITGSIFFIILYGLKLGQEESKTWLATISLILIQEFLILSPFKIAIIALFLASNFERFVQISNYNVQIDQFLEAGQSNNIDYSFIVTDRKRSLDMYKPISVMQCSLLREKLRVQKIVYNLVDFFIVISYILVICLVTFGHSIYVKSYANHHADQIVLFKHNAKHVNFHNVRNRTLYYDYLNNNLVNTLFAAKWYNSESLDSTGLRVHKRSKWWTMDKITKLVGPTMFRQIRVDPSKCSLNKMTVNSSVECIPNWGPGVEDEDDYSYGWKSSTHIHKYDKSSAWRYVPSSQSVRLSRQGGTWTSYHGGGYMTSVSAEKRETEFTMQILTESKWINEFTRVVFLDFTLFNVNENMFTEVVLIAEHLPFGLYVTRTMINSVQLDLVQSGWNAGFVLFILFILFHIIRILWSMNRVGLVKFCLRFENIYQILVTGLGVLSVVLYFCHLKLSVDYMERFQKRGVEVFFNFEEIVYYSIISNDCLTILFCCLCFRLLILWPFGASSQNMYRTLLLSVKTLTRFLILIVLYIFIFCRLLSYLLNRIFFFSAFFWHWAKTVHTPLSSQDSMVLFILSMSVKLFQVFILVIFCYLYKLEKTKEGKRNDLDVLFKWLTRKR